MEVDTALVLWLLIHKQLQKSRQRNEVIIRLYELCDQIRGF